MSFCIWWGKENRPAEIDEQIRRSEQEDELKEIKDNNDFWRRDPIGWFRKFGPRARYGRDKGRS